MLEAGWLKARDVMITRPATPRRPRDHAADQKSVLAVESGARQHQHRPGFPRGDIGKWKKRRDHIPALKGHHRPRRLPDYSIRKEAARARTNTDRRCAASVPD